jgi:hypothetical protein
MPDPYTLSLEGSTIDKILNKANNSDITVSQLLTYLQELVTLPDIDLVYTTSGRSVIGDSPTRQWKRSTGAHTDNGGTIRTISGNDFITMLDWDGNVQDFGTTGNGITRDDDHIQAAIDAVKTASGGTVYFPQGTYNLQNSLVVNGDDITLEFATDSKLFANAALNKPLIIIKGSDDAATNVNRVVIKGYGILDGNRLNQSEYIKGTNMPFGIIATNVVDLTIQDIELKDCRYQGLIISSYVPASGSGTGIDEIPKAAEGQCQRVNVRNCRFIDIQNGGLIFAGGGDGTADTKECLIEGNYFNDSGISNPDGGTDAINVIDGAQDVIVKNNIAISKGAACLALEAHANRGAGLRDTENVLVSGNHFTCTNTAISGAGAINAGHNNNVIKNITITADNVLIKDGSNGACVNLSEGGLKLSNWVIGGTMITQNSSSSNPMGVHLQSTDATEYENIRVDKMTFLGGTSSSYGIRARFFNTTNKSCLTISDCTFDINNRAILVQDSENIYIKGCVFKNLGQTSGRCVDIRNTSNCSFTDNNFIHITEQTVTALYADNCDYIKSFGNTSDSGLVNSMQFVDCNFVECSNNSLRTQSTASGQGVIKYSVSANTDCRGLKVCDNLLRGNLAGSTLFRIIVNTNSASFDGLIFTNNMYASPNGVTINNPQVIADSSGTAYTVSTVVNDSNIAVQEPAAL